MRTYTPRAFAPLVHEHLLRNPRCALWAGMGVGKTVLVLTHIDLCVHELGDTSKTLVLGPTRVVKNVWPHEAKEWSHLRRLKVVAAVGTPEQRIAALQQDAHVYCINYENLVWLRRWYRDQGKAWPFKRIVADEGTRLKGFRIKQGTSRAGALGEVAWAVGTLTAVIDEFIILTGTPAPNGLKDLWGQTWFLDRGKRLGRSYSAFESRWFGYRRITDALSHRPGVEPVIMPFASEQIHAAVKDICLTVDPKDWFDLREPIVNVIEVDLPPPARRHYKEMEREMFTVLKAGEEVEAFQAGAKSMKCRQIAAGAVYLEDGVTWREIHDAKIEALRSVIEEAAGMPVLVSYYFVPDLERLKKAFPQGREMDDKKSTEDAWNAGEIPLMFVQPKSAGHGLSLQHGGNIIAFFNIDWNLEEHLQVIERIGPTRQAQSGYDRAVFVHYILARDTVDMALKARLTGKVSVQQALLDYMKIAEKRIKTT